MPHDCWSHGRTPLLEAQAHLGQRCFHSSLVDIFCEDIRGILLSQDFEQRCVDLNARVSRMPYYRSLLDNHLKRYAEEMDIVTVNFAKHAAAIKKLGVP